MRKLLFIIAAMFSMAAFAADDPIDRLVTKLSANGFWGNGREIHIHLPATATTKQVAAEYFSQYEVKEGKVVNFTTLDSREVQLPSFPKGDASMVVNNEVEGKKNTFVVHSHAGPFIASLIDTDVAGKKIVLIQYRQSAYPGTDTSGYWFVKVFDVTELTPESK